MKPQFNHNKAKNIYYRAYIPYCGNQAMKSILDSIAIYLELV